MFFRFGVKKNWNTLQVFILHLAICDVLYCAVPLPFYASLYLGKQWIFGEFWCKMTPILAHLFAYVGWMALALIALSRALSLVNADAWKNFCNGGGSKRIILFIWILVLFILLPSFFEVCTIIIITSHLDINHQFRLLIIIHPYF